MLQERVSTFVYALAAGLSGPAAAREAGYTGQPGSLRKAAYRLRKNPAVQAALAQIQHEDKRRALARRYEALKFLTRQLRFNPSALVNDDGTINLALAKQSGTLELLEGLDVVETVEGEGSVTRRVKVRFPDRQAAAEQLARLLGWFKPTKHALNVTKQGQVQALTDEQVERLAERLARRTG